MTVKRALAKTWQRIKEDEPFKEQANNLAVCIYQNEVCVQLHIGYRVQTKAVFDIQVRLKAGKD